MKNKNSNTGLKRKVSATTSIIIVVVFIGVIFAIAFGGKLWKNMTTKHTDPKKYTTGPGIAGEKLRLSSERLGADLSPIPDVKSGGISVRAIRPGASGELQVGDIIMAINNEKVVKTKGLTTLAIETFNVEVGQPVTLEILRDGQAMQLQVTRLADTPYKAGPGGMAGARGPR